MLHGIIIRVIRFPYLLSKKVKFVGGFNNRYNKIGIIAILTVLSIFLINIPMPLFPEAHKTVEPQTEENQTEAYKTEAPTEWLIKWNGEIDPEIYNEVDVLEHVEDQQLFKVRLKPNILKGEWVERWSKHPSIEYISPNVKVTISEQPNDTYLENQEYLKQIQIYEGWDIATNTDTTIAILDTGVDLYHPDLKENLVEGYNFLDKNALPQDDNGHGTNVTGIVAAVGNNNQGTAGISWKTKIMPLKVLDHKGEGESFIVGQGIRYAVDKGAEIILLSLGEPIYTPFMKEAVDYAEENGVLVVAATGNEGNRLNYPAALPDVLSVGAVNLEDKYVSYSNYGQQIDVVAPGEGIYTTKQGGGYISNTGTSMAAPQVAGLAALIKQLHPTITPRQIRDLIKFTADDVHDTGWDSKTGYGRINVKSALEAPLSILKDGFEPNDERNTAVIFPLYDSIQAQISYKDTDWYQMHLPYKGNLQLELQLEQEVPYPLSIQVITMEGETQDAASYKVTKQQKIDLNLPEGDVWIKIEFPNASPEQTAQIEHELDPSLKIDYMLKSNFIIYKDRYEGNEYSWDAYLIENLNKVITGTFHQEKDVDWYKLHFDQQGKLMIRVSVDTLRMDPMITVQFSDRKREEIDDMGWGKTEFTTIDIKPGDYYIQIADYNGYSAIEGEYTLEFLFYNQFDDRYEPNDLSSTAKVIKLNETIYSKIEGVNDIDWFKVELKVPMYLDFSFKGDSPTEVTFYNNQLRKEWDFVSEEESNQQVMEAGTYYIRLRSEEELVSYQFKVNSRELDGAFTDIGNHWAKDTIVKLYQEGIVSGFDDYTFRPELKITRAEVAAMVDRVLKLPEVDRNASPIFKDVPKNSWAYQPIMNLYHQEIMKGYEDFIFKPDQPIARDEIVVILTRAFHLPKYHELSSSYKDVTIGSFGFTEINTFKKYGWAVGFEDGTFRPRQTASRAEFLAMLSRVKNIEQIQQEGE